MEDNLKKIESYRKDALLWNVGAVSCGILVIVIGGFRFAFLGVGIVFIGLIIGSKKVARFKHEYKDYFLREPFKKEFNTNIQIDWNGIDLGLIEESFVIPFGNSNTSDDCVSFEYEGIKVQRADVSTVRVTNNGKTQTRTTLFNGQYMIFSYPKEIKGFTVVRRNEWFDSKPGGLFSGCPKTEKIELESEQFNKEFVVFTNDDHEAFYLLTPAFMEALIEFKQYYQANVFFGFMHNEFHVAIDSGRNMFEPSIMNSVSKDDHQLHSKDIEHIKTVIKQLNLKERD